MLKKFFITATSVFVLSLTAPLKVSAFEESALQEIRMEREAATLRAQENEILCLAWNVYGETRGESMQHKVDVAAFTISESEKIGRSLCDEVMARKDGGAWKYSWNGVRPHIVRLPKKNDVEAIAWNRSKEVARLAYHGDLNKIVSWMGDYTNYVTVKLARENPPYWFKYHLKGYVIRGEHVFANVTHKRQSINNYKRFKKEAS